MKVRLNGEEFSTQKGINVADFLENLSKDQGIELQSCVFLLNDDVIKKDKYQNTTINENDTIEVLSFVSGG